MLKETQIGSTATFRPTEAEKQILLNVADMADQGRSVTQQDAINIPEEKLQQLGIGDDNLESAFAQLVKLRLVTVKPDQTLEISPTGKPVVDELKKAQDQEDLTQSTDKNATPDTMGAGADQNPNPLAQPGQNQNPDFSFGEGFSLIRDLNDLSKLLG